MPNTKKRKWGKREWNEKWRKRIKAASNKRISDDDDGGGKKDARECVDERSKFVVESNNDPDSAKTSSKTSRVEAGDSFLQRLKQPPPPEDDEDDEDAAKKLLSLQPSPEATEGAKQGAGVNERSTAAARPGANRDDVAYNRCSLKELVDLVRDKKAEWKKHQAEADAEIIELAAKGVQFEKIRRADALKDELVEVLHATNKKLIKDILGTIRSVYATYN